MSEYLVLESQKYLGSNQLKCYCCGSGISAKGEACGNCHMPISISVAAEDENRLPTFIPILGSSGAGKTVFVGVLLDLLSKGKQQISGQPNNAFSISIQQETMTALERRRFPEKTPIELEEWNWVHCEIEYKIKRRTCFLDVVAPDLAGEALVMELDHPNSFPVVKHCISKAAGIVLLLDASKINEHATEEDLLATKIATYVHSQVANQNNEDLAVAVTFTKTDLCPVAAEDPIKFARHSLPSFMAYSEKHLPNVNFFASSVVGSVSKVSGQFGDYHVPLHVQPKGIVEPLAWMMTQS